MKVLKVLIIANAFSPTHAIGAVRPSKIAKYFTRKGHDVHIITSSKNYFSVDEILAADQDEYGKIANVNPRLIGHIARLLRNKIVGVSIKAVQKNVISTSENGTQNSLIKLILVIRRKLIMKLKYIEDESWSKATNKYINKKSFNFKFDIAFTSFSPASNLMTGSNIMKNKVAHFWIADFRDPMIQNKYDTVSNKFLDKLQEKVLKEASLVTTVSKGIRDDLLNHNLNYKINDLEKRLRVIYNGFDTDDLNKITYKNIKDERYKISYCGSLYRGKRDLRVLFKALQDIISQNTDLLNVIEFHYAGPDARIVDEWAKEYNVENVVKNHGQVSRNEALILQAESKLILVITWNGNQSNEKGVIPGKIYEAMMFNNKILAIIIGDEKNSELKNIISSYKLGYAFETTYSDMFLKQEELLKFLYNDIVINKEKNFPSTVKINKHFAYTNIVDELLNYYSQLTNNQ